MSIELTARFYSLNTEFSIKNPKGLTKEHKQIIYDFVTIRGGYFREDLNKFGIKKKWDLVYVTKLFKALELPFIVNDESEEKEEDKLCNQLVNFGKYRCSQWKDVPLDYLNWALQNLGESEPEVTELAYTEIKRRRNELIEDPVLDFGKHQGKKYSDLPYDYLRWLNSNLKFDDPRRVYLQTALERKKK